MAPRAARRSRSRRLADFAGPLPQCLARRRSRSSEAARLADGLSMAIETLHIPAQVVPMCGRGISRARSTNSCARATGSRSRRPSNDSADGDEQGGVTRARRCSAFAGVPLRAHEPRLRRPGHSEFVYSIYRGDRYRIVSEAVTPSCNSFVTGPGQEVIRCGRFRCAAADWYQDHARRTAGHRASSRPRDVSDALANASTPRGRFDMRYRVLAGVAVAVALSAVVATTAQSSKAAAGHTLTVWLQVDAQNGWPELVAQANTAFQNSHPGWNVNVQYQQWGDHLQKFDATIAGNDTPDVIEMGNTEMTAYMAANAFTNLGSVKGQFDNSSKWLAGLKASSTYDGQLFGGAVLRRFARHHVPHRSCSRRRAPRSRRRSPCSSRASSPRSGRWRSTIKGFAPLYVGGEDWYTALSFVYDYGGSIAAKSHGKWSRHARFEEVGRRPPAVQVLLQGHPAEVDGSSSTAPTRIRTPCSRRGRTGCETTGPPGTRAAPARSTRARPGSS